MSWEYTHYVLPLLLPGILSGLMAIRIWPRARAGAKPLIALMVATAIWSLGHAAEIMGADLAGKTLCTKFQYLGIVALPVAWLSVALQHAGRGQAITRRLLVVLSALPVAALVLVWTNEWHGLIWRDTWVAETGPVSVLSVEHGPAFWVFIAYAYVLYLGGGLLLAATAFRSPRLYLGQRMVLLLALALPFIANVMYVTERGPRVDLTAFAFAISTLIMALGVFRLQVADLVPLARSAVMDMMPDGVFVLDRRNRVIDLNAEAGDIIGLSPPDAIGLPLEDLPLGAPPLDACLAGDAEVEVEIILDVGGQPRVYTAHVLPLRKRRGIPVERLIVCHDITKRKQALDALRKEQDFNARLISSSPSFFVAIDADGRTLMMSPSMLRSLRYTEEEVLGADYAETFVPEADRELFASVVGKLLTSDASTLNENRVLAKDGRELLVEWHGRSVFKDNGGFDFFFGVGNDITERKRAEEALRESEQKVRAILDQTFQFIGLMTPDGRLVEANRASLAFAGVDESDVIGEHFWETPWWSHSPELQGQLRDGIRRAAAGEFVRFEAFHLLPDGTVQYMDVSLKPVEDETGKVVYVIPEGRDITERKRAEEALRDSEAHLRSVFRSAPTGIGLVTNRILKDANSRLCEMLGYAKEQLIDKSSRMLYPTDEEFEHVGKEKYRQISEFGTGTVETRWVCADGRIIDVLLSSTPLDIDNLSKGVTFTALDITERKRAAEERLSLERQMQQAQKLESLGVLAGGIAHDFNNILMAILGYSDLALQNLSSTHPARSNIEEVLKGAKRAAGLTRQMLAYSGKGRFVIEEIDVTELIDDMAHLLRTSISRKISLGVNLERDLPAIEADVVQMQQIVMNLITNAAEAIGELAGAIALSTGQMECTEEYLAQGLVATASSDKGCPAGAYVYFEVSDTGCGMDEDTKSRIFDPFFTTKFTGRGLGMAAAAGIVRGHKGAMMLETTPGKGSTFRVLIPAVESRKENAAGQARPEAKNLHQHEGGAVLVVDDEAMVRTLAADILGPRGFTVLTAADGLEALSVFREHASEIDCVLLDLTMPHMDGEACFHELRQIREDVPVILMSGYNQQQATQEFAGHGLAGFLQKPYQSADLMAKLHDVLDAGE